MTNNLYKIVDRNQKESYVKCISKIAAELSQITLKLNSNVKIVYEDAKNDIKIIDDVIRVSNEILLILANTEANFNAARSNFIISHDSWLKNCSDSAIVLSSCPTETSSEDQSSSFCTLDANQNKRIIDLEDPNVSDIQICGEHISDVQIVNEIKYRKRQKNDSAVNYAEIDKAPDCIDLSYSEHIAQDPLDRDLEQNSQKRSYIKLPFKDSSIKDVTNDVQNEENSNIEGNQNNEYLEQVVPKKPDFNSSELFRNNNYSGLNDTKLHSGCFVQLESLNEQAFKKLSNHRKIAGKLSDDKAFLRLIDLSRLERQKRRYSTSSDCSTTSNSSGSDNSLVQKRIKRRKVAVDDSTSDITSYYESSEGDDNADNLTSENMKIDEPSFVNLDTKEENAKLLLLQESDVSSGYSDVQTDSDADESENSVKKNKIKKISLESKTVDKKTHSRSAWLNDELLRFKLPFDKTYGKRVLKEFNDAEPSTSSNDTASESMTSYNKEVTKMNGEITEVESIESSLSEDSESSESSSEDLDSEDANNDFETSISIPTPKKKIAGRKNIRPVLAIAENTRQALEDEQKRVQRLAEHKEQLNTLEPEKREDSLILDYDVKTKKILAVVDRGLAKLLKSHQKEGVQFMWNCCIESAEQLKVCEGSGCILAHCMGLGKTLQVITLVHTLLVTNLGIKTVVIVCPTNTVLNWVDEFNMWLARAESKSNIKIFQLTRITETSQRIRELDKWQRQGGVLIISYESFRSFTSSGAKQANKMRELLINPGADLVVCDEGHLLKRETSQIADRMQQVQTQRRIILTGTPLQNNLNEYHCMVQFVKPNLLGTKKEFANRFANPIENGQYGNSTPDDVKLMKRRAHVLHRLLESCVQRCDYAVLKPLLPEKQEYVITVRLSELLERMYQHYISYVINAVDKRSNLMKIYNEIKRLVAHPKTLELKVKHQLKQQKNYDKRRSKRKSKNSPIADEDPENDEGTVAEFWWRDVTKELKLDVEKDLEDVTISYKLMLLFGMLESCEKKHDKILVFSQCLHTLDLIERYLRKSNSTSDRGLPFKFEGEWKRDIHYFRLDGNVKPSVRRMMCNKFNDQTNKARLFLISTKAGGLGINLTGANRVVVFDPSWNPSNDLQSIFRVFRFGQDKPCYIYRFLTAGTMEEKIYIRQVIKLSLSLRVVDEQQIGRHYTNTDLTNLYELEPLAHEGPKFNRPRDDLLAEVISKYSKYVYNVFEHDSLLQNNEEEKLNEEEREQAWLDYEKNLADEEASRTSVESNEVLETEPVSNDSTDLSE